MLSRWLKVFYLGSPLYRNVVATLSALALLFVITALGLALGRDDVAAQYLLGATAVVVLFMCITLMCATPSGAATQVFKVLL